MFRIILASATVARADLISADFNQGVGVASRRDGMGTPPQEGFGTPRSMSIWR
jgi:hypothetical protein